MEEAVRRSEVGEAPLGGVARERLLGAIIERRGIPAARGYVRALGAFIAELRVSRVTPGAAGRRAGGAGGPRRAGIPPR